MELRVNNYGTGRNAMHIITGNTNRDGCHQNCTTGIYK